MFIPPGHKDSIYSLVITPDSSLLVAGGTEHFLRYIFGEKVVELNGSDFTVIKI